MFPSLHKFAFITAALLQNIATSWSLQSSSLRAVVVTCLPTYTVVRCMLNGNGVLHKKRKMRCCEFDDLVGVLDVKIRLDRGHNMLPPLRRQTRDTISSVSM
ncbi:hypothetical protein CDAR_41 [Caerostris darwini]|uniref:Secreted protein n=1 Tax=Caerostris darwini TaxID=1538125 RepID=A0AAV4TU93_9ARAC|nr:hypothetical protein CDAR_41 [Caerostris darwini]